MALLILQALLSVMGKAMCDVISCFMLPNVTACYSFIQAKETHLDQYSG